jgi:hypothetical protein
VVSSGSGRFNPQKEPPKPFGIRLGGPCLKQNEWRNNIGNDVLRDVKQRLHKGVPYFQIFVRFHGISVTVISLTPIRKVQLLTKLVNSHQLYVQITYTGADHLHGTSPKSDNKCVQWGETFIYIPKGRTAFTAQTFHETRPSLDRCFVNNSCFNFFFKSDKKYRKYEHNFSEVRLTVNTFSWKSQPLLTALCADLLHCTEFHTHRPRLMKGKTSNSFIPLGKAWLPMRWFSQNSRLLDYVLWHNSYAEYHENPTHHLITHTRSQTDRRT